MDKILDLSLIEIRDQIRAGKITSLEAAKACLGQINSTKEVNALISSASLDEIKDACEKADLEVKKGNKLPLLGVPVVVKDNISTLEYETTCASKFLKGYKAPYEATVVKKLKDAGAIIIGKANMDEFAMGASGENSAFGKTLNPVNYDYVPGGSSSGSAATVAAKQCYASLGTDTGGSIRQPAGFCGVVGIKPTYGRVSRYGVVAFASSLDQVGPITKTVEDNALMLDVISGEDNSDATSVKRQDKEFASCCHKTIKGMKIGVAKEYFSFTMDKEVRAAIEETVEFYKNNGAEIVEISLPNIDKALAAYYVLSSAEAASNLSRFDGIKYGNAASKYDGLIDLYYKSRSQGFGDEVKRRIMMGNYCLSAGYYDAYYKKSLQVQQLLKKEFAAAFKKCDAIISPISPATAFKFGAKATPLEMYLADVYTVPVNIVGVPAISFKVGSSKEGLPIACQLIGDMWQEGKLYTLASYYEDNTKGGKN